MRKNTWKPFVFRYYVGAGGVQTRKEFRVCADGGTWLRRMWEIYGEHLHVQDVHGKWRTRNAHAVVEINDE